ncbi:hypothetical protein ABGN05_27200 [Aquibium sp. LZ166]|uniref:Uncharacterized protein n=1 Tax=Aquibium pacificus TaxID=3153579 RepID=A0ABV3SRA2_9HYPH
MSTGHPLWQRIKDLFRSSRPVRDLGEPHQEVGGVMVTLAALCAANGLDMERSGAQELDRIEDEP